MATFTSVRLADPNGVHLIEIANYAKLDYVLNCSPGGIGVLELTLPTSFDTSLLLRDGRMGVWRSIDGRPPYLDNGAIYLIETFVNTSAATFVRAYHASCIMARRIIAYYAGSTYASKTGPADDLIKAFWNENAGAGVTATRDADLANVDISAYVSLQANLGQGVSITKEACRRNLLEVARECADASTVGGTYITFEIIAPTESTLELRTYAISRGVDHRAGTANPVILSEARGNLEQTTLTIDYHDIATVVYAGGPGEKIDRIVTTDRDFALTTAEPFARHERFIDSSNSTNVQLAAAATAELRAARPTTVMHGNLIETPATTRGIQFDLGDIVTIEDPRSGQQFDMRLDVVHESFTAGEHAADYDLSKAVGLRAQAPIVSEPPRKTRVGLRSLT